VKQHKRWRYGLWRDSFFPAGPLNQKMQSWLSHKKMSEKNLPAKLQMLKPIKRRLNKTTELVGKEYWHYNDKQNIKADTVPAASNQQSIQLMR
jgi:hypothetical protein